MQHRQTLSRDFETSLDELDAAIRALASSSDDDALIPISVAPMEDAAPPPPDPPHRWWAPPPALSWTPPPPAAPERVSYTIYRAPPVRIRLRRGAPKSGSALASALLCALGFAVTLTGICVLSLTLTQ